MKNSWVQVLMCLIIAVGASLAVADTSVLSLSDSYRYQTFKILKNLQRFGINQVACHVKRCLSVTELADKLMQIQFVELPQFQKPVGATRETAFYRSADNTIYLNRSALHPVELQGPLGFHELLGIFGINESEYQLTLLATAVVKATFLNEAELKFLKKSLQGNTTFQGAYEPTPITDANSNLKTAGTSSSGSGSGSVIGNGGGDEAALGQRILFYDYLRRSQTCLHLAIPLTAVFQYNVPIEISDTSGEEIVYVGSKDQDFWPRHIIVPRAMINLPPVKDLAAPNRALEDIALYLASARMPVLKPPLFCQYDFVWELLKSEKRFTADFWYPKNPEKLHPEVVRKFLRPSYQAKCPSGTCKPAGPWAEFIFLEMYR